jgi:hypothetical protein
VADNRHVSNPVPTGQPNRRLGQTVGDMARSLAVVLAVVGVVLLITWRPQPDAVKVVDVDPFFALASDQAAFEPLRVPPALDGYRPTSVRWQATAESSGESVWFVGYVTPSDGYLQISQSLASTEDFLLEQTANGLAAGELEIDGVIWDRYESDGRRSLVRQSDVTTVVSGTESWDAIATAAGFLVGPQPG